MNNEEKILTMLTQMQDDLTQVKATQSQMQDDFTRMQGDLTRMQDDLTRMQDDITHVKVCLDYDVEKRFDAVNEGIDTILETLAPKNRVEALEDEMVFLKSVIKSMSQRIAELEKAQ